MIDKISNKKKFLFVAGFTLLLGIFAFYRSILPTLELRKKCNAMQQELDSTKASTEELQLLKLELSQLNSIVGSETKNVDEINRGIVNFIGENSKDLSVFLVDFPSVHDYRENDYSIYTHQAVIEGNFQNLLELVYNLEFQFEGARVCSIRFYSKEEFKTKKKHLYSIIYIQNIKKNA